MWLALQLAWGLLRALALGSLTRSAQLLVLAQRLVLEPQLALVRAPPLAQAQLQARARARQKLSAPLPVQDQLQRQAMG
jgi:hypothetical protein